MRGKRKKSSCETPHIGCDVLPLTPALSRKGRGRKLVREGDAELADQLVVVAVVERLQPLGVEVEVLERAGQAPGAVVGRDERQRDAGGDAGADVAEEFLVAA